MARHFLKPFMTLCLPLFLAILVSSCASPEHINTLINKRNASLDSLITAKQQHNFPDNPVLREWGTLVERFYYADSQTVILPYINLIRQFDSVNPEQICDLTSKARFTAALKLNPSSLLANFQLFKCALIDKDRPLAAAYNEKIDHIVAVLKATGNSKTLQTAIEIREIDESYALLELDGFAVLDVEIVRDGDGLVYQFHVIDLAQRKYHLRYFKNNRLLTAILSGLGGGPLTEKRAAQISLSSYQREKYSAALVPLARHQLANQQYADAIKILTPVYQDSALATTLLAEAYLKSGQRSQILPLLELIDLAAQNGLIEAKLLLGQYLHLYATTDKKLTESDSLLLEIDQLTRPGNGVHLLAKKLAAYPNKPQLLTTWLDRSNNLQILDALPEVATHWHDSQRHEDEYNLLQLGAGYEHGQSLYQLAHGVRQGDFVESGNGVVVRYLQRAAEAGHSDAQLDLGYYHATGELGLVEDSTLAFQWYGRAAEQGNAWALFNIANYYRDGTVVEHNLAEAKGYYKRSIAAGYLGAYCELGKLYRDVDNNLDLALENFKLGAAQREVGCELALGYSYEKNLNDLTQAHSWYQKAAEQGSSTALFNLGLIYHYGRGVVKDIPKAIEFYVKSAELGDDTAWLNLAIIYDFGQGVGADHALALKYYQRAADLGNGQAQSNLGFMYEVGKGVAVDAVKAHIWYEKSASQNNPQGLNNLATFYREGVVVAQNQAKAVDLYRRAAALGNDYALNNLGKCYLQGWGIEKNDVAAFSHFKQAADRGFEDAIEWTGLMYFDGVGVDKDEEKAIVYLQKTSAAGYPSSSYALGELYFERDIQRSLTLYQLAYEQGHNEAPMVLGLIYDKAMKVARDVESAASWYQKSLDMGFVPAANLLAVLYWKGDGVSLDKDKAVSLFSQYAQFKGYNGNSHIGDELYFGDDNMPKDRELARHYYQLAVAENDKGATNNLAEMHRLGEGGLEVDIDRAVALYHQAVALGSSVALFNLGELYRDGEGVKQDAKQALSWFKRSADKGFARAMYELAKMYQQGQGTVVDLDTANSWYAKAAADDLPAAQFALGKNTFYGQGIPRNEVKGSELIRLSAESGFAPAIAFVKNKENDD